MRWLCVPRSLRIARDSSEENGAPLSEKRYAGHPQVGMYSLMET